MKPTGFSVTYGRKWNLGDFNSLHIELTAWAELGEGEGLAEASAALFAEVKDAVRVQALPVLKPAHKPEVVQTFAGVPVVTPNGGKDENT